VVSAPVTGAGCATDRCFVCTTPQHSPRDRRRRQRRRGLEHPRHLVERPRDHLVVAGDGDQALHVDRIEEAQRVAHDEQALGKLRSLS